MQLGMNAEQADAGTQRSHFIGLRFHSGKAVKLFPFFLKEAREMLKLMS
jgi:hypothetical protein